MTESLDNLHDSPSSPRSREVIEQTLSSHYQSATFIKEAMADGNNTMNSILGENSSPPFLGLIEKQESEILEIPL